MRVLEEVIGRFPRGLRRIARRTALFPADVFDRVRGRDPLLPPRGMRAVGAGEFREVGEMMVSLFRAKGGLSPSDHVLDVGCGIGRMAVPLTRFLDDRGTYEGFDVSRIDIEWCRLAISTRYRRFSFVHVDVQNSEYNPRGGISPETLRFPYPDSSFDFLFATSVFSHLLPAAAARYLSEIARVLKPDGHLFLTAFVLSPDALFAMATCRVAFRFDTPSQGAFVHDLRTPESPIAYEEAGLRRMLETSGLAVKTLDRGTWSGGRSPSFQDAIVCSRALAR